MTLKELKKHIVTSLAHAVGGTEAEAMARVIFEDVLGVDTVAAALNPDRQLCSESVEPVETILRRVSEGGEPLQYVLGNCLFHGLKLNVTPAVLIPRPETSGLVDIVVDTAAGRPDLRVLDVGTGSGAIAIALARTLPFCSVTAVDVSADALEVARGNCRELGVKNVKTVLRDVLRQGLPSEEFDIIVSNPPYVQESERVAMSERVLAHEPSVALFVPDSDPLVFYRRIVEGCRMQASVKLFFEINPLLANDVKALLESSGCDEVEILRDYRGKQRYATARHNG